MHLIQVCGLAVKSDFYGRNAQLFNIYDFLSMIKSINLTPFVQYPPTIQFIPCGYTVDTLDTLRTEQGWRSSRS